MTDPEILFDLASELAAIYRRADDGRIQVLPILVDDLGEAQVVLEALCKLTGGRLLSSEEVELQSAVPGTTSHLILPAVEAALTTVPSGGTRRVVPSITAGLADAAFVELDCGAGFGLDSNSDRMGRPAQLFQSWRVR